MTDCARCGDCCENIQTSWDLEHLRKTAEKEGDDSPNAANYRFVRDNWVDQGIDPNGAGGVTWTCLKFDSVGRTCTAHEDRPPVCSGYPWYGKEPFKGAWLPAACSFQADIKTMLPIVEVSNGPRRAN